MHLSGIGPESHPWQGCILPLNHRRYNFRWMYVKDGILVFVKNIIIKIEIYKIKSLYLLEINNNTIYSKIKNKIKFRSLMCYLQYHSIIFIMQHRYQLLIQTHQLLIQWIQQYPLPISTIRDYRSTIIQYYNLQWLWILVSIF